MRSSRNAGGVYAGPVAKADVAETHVPEHGTYPLGLGLRERRRLARAGAGDDPVQAGAAPNQGRYLRV